MASFEYPARSATAQSDGELTDSVMEMLPEQRTFSMPGDPKVETIRPFVLTREHIQWLYTRCRIPPECQVDTEWFLVYSTDYHGCSLQTMYRRSAFFMEARAFRCCCLLVVRDFKSNTFGILMSHLPHISSHTYGVPSETRLYNLAERRNDRKLFTPSQNFQGLMVGSSQMLNIGIDNHGHMAISIFECLTRAHLEPCAAFDGLETTTLYGTNDTWLEIECLELWSFKHPIVF